MKMNFLYIKHLQKYLTIVRAPSVSYNNKIIINGKANSRRYDEILDPETRDAGKSLS